MCFRELDTVVHQFNPSGLWSGVLLLYSWPKDIFVDPFQLASLSNQSNWEVGNLFLFKLENVCFFFLNHI